MKTPGSFALQSMHNPLAFRNGSPESGLTLIIDIGYIDGIMREMNPIDPTVLSTFTEIKMNRYIIF